MIRQYLDRAEIEYKVAVSISELYNEDYRYVNIIADHISCSIDMIVKFIMRCHGIGFPESRQSITSMIAVADYNHIDLLMSDDIIQCLHLLDTWNMEARTNLNIDICIEECNTVLDAIPEYIEIVQKVYYYIIEE